MPASFTCRICGDTDAHTRHRAREMMFGTREAFTYVECRRCGCVQIETVPPDLARYYPADYYSYGAEPPGRLRRLAKRQRLRHALGLSAVGGAALTRRFGPSPIGAWLGRLGVALDRPILDVGAGSGTLLHELRDAGFTHLVGADPFVEADSEARGVRVLKREIGDVEGTFAVVMMHHTFEHLAHPEAALRAAADRLEPEGHLVLRIPVADSFAWRHYGVDWVQFDAPRHLYLHTRRSLDLIAGNAGLAVVDVIYDSTGFQLWGSEQYRRDIPLYDPCSYAVSPEASPFSPEEIVAFEHRAEALNATADGDQAAFIIRKA